MPTIKIRDPQGNWVDAYSGGGDTLLDIIDAKIAAHCPYEPGDYCISDNGTSPAERWPGTVWAQLPPGTFLMAAGEGYAVGSTGGAKVHAHGLGAGYAKLSMASKTVRNKSKSVSPWTASNYIKSTEQGDSSYGDPDATELGGTTDNQEALPPYYATNIWRRTA